MLSVEKRFISSLLMNGLTKRKSSCWFEQYDKAQNECHTHPHPVETRSVLAEGNLHSQAFKGIRIRLELLGFELSRVKFVSKCPGGELQNVRVNREVRVIVSSRYRDSTYFEEDKVLFAFSVGPARFFISSDSKCKQTRSFDRLNFRYFYNYLVDKIFNTPL